MSTPYKCEACRDTGFLGWEKPMGCVGGVIHMVFVPQICICRSGSFAEIQKTVDLNQVNIANIVSNNPPSK